MTTDKSRKAWSWLAMALVALGVPLGIGEIVVRVFAPTEYLSPRFEFSNEYGMVPFANVVMVNGVPGKFQFRYTVNSMRTRGDVIEPGASGLPAVVVLGDSYSFGIGVQDNEEYPAVMRRALAGKADVASLASPGWGLTQEIRRYYELGVRHHPRIVVLQFCVNDPEDNFSNQVTRVENGALTFRDSGHSTTAIKTHLARSPVQRSQLYNFVRQRASILATRGLMQRKTEQMRETRIADTGDHVPVAEAMHIELLSTFAAKLREDGSQLWLIAVDHQLEKFPHIERAVSDLDERGELRYLEVAGWLEPIGPHTSLEGHLWDGAAHRVIGEHLAAEVTATLDKKIR